MQHADAAGPLAWDPRWRVMALFAALSTLVHLIVLLLPAPRFGPTADSAALVPVELLALPAKERALEPRPQEQKIVPPSDLAREEEPQAPTRFVSEKSSRAREETIRHGMPRASARASAARLEPERAQPPSSPPPPRLALDDLFKKPGEVFAGKEERGRRTTEARPTPQPKTGKRRIDLALGTIGNLSSFTGGVPDYLPEIRPGQFTLLNAKANLFAPFVRRVGLRVFEHLLIRQRRLAERELLAAQGEAVVRVVLGTDGKLLDLRTEGVSGSRALDEALRKACQLGAFDNNPPEGARKADGTYEFVFQAWLRPWTTDGQRVGRVDSFLSIRLL